MKLKKMLLDFDIARLNERKQKLEQSIAKNKNIIKKLERQLKDKR